MSISSKMSAWMRIAGTVRASAFVRRRSAVETYRCGERLARLYASGVYGLTCMLGRVGEPFRISLGPELFVRLDSNTLSLLDLRRIRDF